MPPTPNPSTPSYAHDPGDPQHPHTAAQKQGAPSEKEIEGGKWRGTDRDSPALLPPSIRERSRRNPRSCGAAGAAHTPAPGAGNPGSSAAVEAEPEACGRGLGAVAGGEAKAAEGGESGSGAGWRLGRRRWWGGVLWFGCALRRRHHAARAVAHRAPVTSCAQAGLALGFGSGRGDRLGCVTRLWSVATREERRSKSLRSGPMERDSQGSALPWSWPVAPIVGVNI